MTALAEYIIRKQVPVGENPELPKFRGNIGIAQGWISICANFFLFGLKLIFGFLSNSIALIADAFHTLSDMASSAVVVLVLRWLPSRRTKNILLVMAGQRPLQRLPSQF